MSESTIDDEWQRAGAVIIEHEDLHVSLALVRCVLLIGENIPDGKKYPNSVACLAALTRGYHDSLAALDLCANHHYVQARGMFRSIYEAGSLARTLADSPRLADKWINGEWQRDEKTRQFAANKMDAEGTKESRAETKAAYDHAYEELSAWAHITARSALIYLTDIDGGGIAVPLEPMFDEGELRSALDELTKIVFYLVSTAKNSLGTGKEVLEADWFQLFEDVGSRLTPNFRPSGTDWAQHNKTHEALMNKLQSNSTLKRDRNRSLSAFNNLVSDE